MALSAQKVEEALPGGKRRKGGNQAPWQPGDRGQLAIIAFSHAVQHSYVAVLGIVYPFALASFHTSYAVLGGILAAAGIIGGLLQGTAAIIKKLSTRSLLAAQNLGMGICSGLGAIAPGISLFGAARVLANLTSWPQHPVGSAHLTERIPHRRGFALAVHTTGGNVGTLLAPLAAAAVVASFGWRWALGGAGLIMALGSLVTWTGVRAQAAPSATEQSQKTADASAPGGAGTAAPAPAADPVSLRKALRQREAVSVLVAGTVSGAGRGLGVLMTYIPAYLRTGLHERTLIVGLVATMVSVGALGGPMIGGHLSDRVGRRPVLYTLYLCGAAALVGFVLVGSSVLYLALMALAVGAFCYSEQPLRQALFSDAMQGVSARKAFGAYFAISQSMGAIWIAVLGVLITASGFRTAFFVMGGSFIVAATIIALGRSKKVAVSS